MVSRLRRAMAGVLVSLFVSATVSTAQTTFGSIRGIVSNPAGAPIPRATVTVTNEGTGSIRHVMTGATGDFSVASLDVGSYRISVNAAGFSSYQHEGLILAANQVINLNITLALGTVIAPTQEKVPVPIINTTNATLSGLVTSQSIEALPETARQSAEGGFEDMMALNTGTSTGAADVINGTNQASGELLAADGIALLGNMSDFGVNEEQPSYGAVQEVSVITSNAPAEFAWPVATTQVTKGGTNEFHGGAFELYNGNALNTRDFFSPNIPARVYNNFGADLGGPIRKNKTFFFFSYEGSRTGAKQLLVASVPLPAWRNGDLSSLLSQGIVISDPSTGLPFPNNLIPSNLISGVSQKVESLYPLPNFGPPGTATNNYRQNFPGVGTTVWDAYNARVDYNFSTRDTIFGRFNIRGVPQMYVNDLPIIGVVSQHRHGQGSVFSWTHIFAPTVVNEFRMGYVRGHNIYFPVTIGSDLIQQFGIQGVSVKGIHNVPAFDITGVTSIDMDAAGNQYEDHLQPTLEYIDDLSWAKGKHSLKFGFDAIHDQLYGSKYSSSIYGQYSFPGVYTGFGYADFLLGIPETTTLSVPSPYNYIRGTLWGLYVQDEFKISKRLVFSYGLRWDLQSPYAEKHGKIYNFDPQTGALVVPDNGADAISPLFPKNISIVTASQAGFPRDSMIDFHKDQIRPRVGFAYAPWRNGKTVIRGGYGIYSNIVYADLPTHMIGGPFSGAATYINAINNGVPLFSFPDPFLAAGTISTQNITGVNPVFKPPYTQQWNFTLERQAGSVALRASYVGTHAGDLLFPRNLNQPRPGPAPFSVSKRPYPLYNQVIWLDSGGNEDFNALEVSATKTYGKNLTFATGWTWAKDLTDVGNSTSVRGVQIQNQFNREAERGNNPDTLPQRWFGYASYAIPVGDGQRFVSHASPLVNALLDGWNTSWNISVQSGHFFTPTFDGFDPSNTAVFGGRPDRIVGAPLYTSRRSINSWFNANAFKVPGCPDSQPLCPNPANVARFGNAGVGILQGPGAVYFDFSLAKTFPIRETTNLQFRVNMVNALNHPNYSNPAADISNITTVGSISATAGTFGELATREIDFKLKLQF